MTNTITQVAGGDFCVEISEGRQDEIGQMKNSMRKYVGDMRETLCKVRELTEKLTVESENSKKTSQNLNSQAAEQSNGMVQIRTVMEDMASAVYELANNAT